MYVSNDSIKLAFTWVFKSRVVDIILILEIFNYDFFKVTEWLCVNARLCCKLTK